jgi:hypothetical protein
MRITSHDPARLKPVPDLQLPARAVDTGVMKLLTYGITATLVGYAAALWALLRRDPTAT